MGIGVCSWPTVRRSYVGLKAGRKTLALLFPDLIADLEDVAPLAVHTKFLSLR
jgi:hypothetical protein